jgi:hypothetical protein
MRCRRITSTSNNGNSPNLHSDLGVNGFGTPASVITPGVSSFSFINSLGMSSALNMSNKATARQQRVRRLNDG